MVLVGVIVLRSSRVTGVIGLIITVIANQNQKKTKMKMKKKKMIDDIVTRLRKQMSNEFVIDHPNMVRVPTIYEEAADEIERIRLLLDNALERENKDNLRQLEIVRKVESDRNRWRATAEVLARELGKVEYADAEWHNQEGLH